MKKLTKSLLCLALAATLFRPVSAMVGEGEDLTELSLNDLMKIEISSVSKRVEPITEAAAAITVLTNADLRNSGARNLAEALRRVPGMQVARADGRQYALSVRGFNSTSADKLEVRIDGRSVYSPLFSGVFWDVFETDLQDVERIEVVRGPGAALYGANAVNGVINVITKSAAATAETGSLQLGFGNEEKTRLNVRQTLRWGETDVRVNAQGYHRDDSRLATGAISLDGSRFQQVNVRGDRAQFAGGALTVQLNAYNAGFAGSAGDTHAAGQSLSGRYSLPSATGESALQFSLERSDRSIPTLFSENRESAKLEFEQQRRVGRHQLVYGLGYSGSRDETGEPPLAILFVPQQRRLDTFSAFVQDQINVAPGLNLTLGSKFEDNDVTGFEMQPSLRLGWRANAERFVWGAVSRAVRTPNRLDQDLAIFCPEPFGFPGFCGPGRFRLGNPKLQSETVIAFETGLRQALATGLSADLALFHNHYQRLRATEPTLPFGTYSNGLKGESDGAELTLNWQASKDTTVQGSYSFLSLRTRAAGASQDRSTSQTNNGSSPRHSLHLNIDSAIHRQLSANAQLRYQSRLPAQALGDRTELGLALRYQVLPRLEWSITGENLLHDQAPEFGTNPATRSELQRSVWMSLTLDW